MVNRALLVHEQQHELPANFESIHSTKLGTFELSSYIHVYACVHNINVQAQGRLSFNTQIAFTYTGSTCIPAYKGPLPNHH